MHNVNKIRDFHIPPEHILWLNQIFLPSQSPMCHIPSLNLGSHGINKINTKQGIQRKPPPSLSHNDFTEYQVQKSTNQYKLGCLLISSPYPTKFSCFHLDHINQDPISNDNLKLNQRGNPLHHIYLGNCISKFCTSTCI